ncbi:hypothetical protein AB0O07_13095 [Streptomyces sp. NPDC093085]|uniref:hypothetical protein n=1 Tax=Streptomyces sp. NPDC093085 TaxID=3155068 RepID=UPI0034334197
MAETRSDTQQQGTGTAGGDSDGAGKHRGGAASAESSAAPAHGRHRRPAEDKSAA